MAWNAWEQIEGCKYCANPTIMELTRCICAACTLLSVISPITRTSSAIFWIFSFSRSISGNGFPTRFSVHVFGSGVFRFLSALTTKPRKCIPSVLRSVTNVFSCDSSSFILLLKYFVSIRFSLYASCSVDVRITQSSAKRKLYFGVTPDHFSRRVSLHLCLHCLCGSIYILPTNQSKSFRYTFDSNGDKIPPCIVPSFVSFSIPLSIYPAFNICCIILITLLSWIPMRHIFFNRILWLMLSKQPLMSPSTVHTGWSGERVAEFITFIMSRIACFCALYGRKP